MPQKDKLDHPALDLISATPEILRALLAGVREDDTLRSPGPGRWSIAEVLEHLSHVEGHLFRRRTDLILTEDSPSVENYDQDVFYAAGTYSAADPEESFAHWEEQRDDNIEFLAALDPIMLARRATHPALGPFTLEELLNAWAAHDLSHIRQISGLVREAVYLAGSGVLR